MFKTIKESRRRMTETVLEKVGKSERTTDEEFDIHVEKFRRMVGDINECGAALHSFLTHQKSLFSDAEELSKSLARIFEQSQMCTDWPGVQCNMQFRDQADLYVQRVGAIHNVLRSSVSTVSVEEALDPLKAAVTAVAPEVERTVKERNTQQKDYDSYKRRLKALEAKRDHLVSQGKEGTPAFESNAAELSKFVVKEQTGLENFMALNEKAKADIVDAKVQHDRLMDHLMLTTIVCQAELFALAASQLEDIVAQLPEDKVQQVRSRIYGYVQQGGIQPPAPKEKTKLEKGLDILTGKQLPPGMNKNKQQPPQPGSMQRLESRTATAPSFAASPSSSSNIDSGDPFASDGNPFAPDDCTSSDPFAPSAPSAPSSPPVASVPPPVSSVPPPPPPPPPPAAAAPQQSETVLVEALFDNEAEDDEELSFAMGDMLEVLEMAEGGWWRGRLNGKEGLFPVNYVKTAGL